MSKITFGRQIDMVAEGVPPNGASLIGYHSGGGGYPAGSLLQKNSSGEISYVGIISVIENNTITESRTITVRKINTDIILEDNDNDTVILLTSSCLVTLPNGLMNGFNVAFSTIEGATMSYELGNLVSLINNNTTTMGGKLSHTIVNTDIPNEYLTTGL